MLVFLCRSVAYTPLGTVSIFMPLSGVHPLGNLFPGELLVPSCPSLTYASLGNSVAPKEPRPWWAANKLFVWQVPFLGTDMLFMLTPSEAARRLCLTYRERARLKDWRTIRCPGWTAQAFVCLQAVSLEQLQPPKPFRMLKLPPSPPLSSLSELHKPYCWKLRNVKRYSEEVWVCWLC
jgi:hypothetical protein